MKKIVLTAIIWGCIMALPLTVFADARGERHGNIFNFEIPPGVTQVADAEALPDGAGITLMGRIEQSLGDAKYNFSDGTGTLVLVIDYSEDDFLNDLSVNAIVKVNGTVRRNFDDWCVVAGNIEKL